MEKTTEGEELIAAERQRQITVEGYTDAHDDLHRDGSLATAAQCYASTAEIQIENGVQRLPPCFIHKNWPWGRSDWKPSNDAIANLVKAGALYQAEIDRCQRIHDSLQNEQAKAIAAKAIKRVEADRNAVADSIDRLQKPLSGPQ